MTAETLAPHRRPPAGSLAHLSHEERARLRRARKLAADARAAHHARKRRTRYARRNRRELLLQAARFVVSVLPLGVAARLGQTMGSLLYVAVPGVRDRIRTQLGIAFGSERSSAELDSLTHASLRTMCRGVFSLPVLARQGAERLLRRVDVEGEEHLRTAAERGRGAIVVTYHYGLPDAGATWLTRNWDGVVVSADTPPVGALRMLIKFREQLGGATIERGSGRAIVRAIRAGRPVAMVADHDVDGVNGVFVPFFGRPAHTPVGPAALAQRLGATIVPAVVEWTSPTTHRLRFLGALTPREDLSRDDATHELTHRFTALGEEAIRARPDHWMWLHRRWRTTPKERPELPVWPAPRS